MYGPQYAYSGGNRTSLADCWIVATRGGLEETVGITWPVASRWDRVKVPSEFGQTMTIGVPDI